LQSKDVKIKTNRTLILPVVVYGCETWSLTLREERRLRVFKNRVLRRIFGSKRDEVIGEWRKLRIEELNNNNNNNNNNIFHCKWTVTRWQWLLCMYINMK